MPNRIPYFGPVIKEKVTYGLKKRIVVEVVIIIFFLVKDLSGRG